MRWKPIEDLPNDAGEWTSREYQDERARWHKVQTALQDPQLDKTALLLWRRERHRLFAIETGQIENLYTMRPGMTETLVTEGLENARASHTVEGVLDDRTLRGLLTDQADAMEMVFQTVKDERPLSQSVIKEWHALLTRHQDTAPGIDQHGKRVGIAFLKGAYKKRPNNPRTTDGSIHEYCPPEHADSEMERLLAMHHEHERNRSLPPAVESAWLHHRFVQIHPFEDGNGRTARLLMSYVFAKRGEPTPLLRADEKPQYFRALQAADRGNLRPFTEMMDRKGRDALIAARTSAETILEEEHRYYHANGDLSTKHATNGWERHHATNGRESVIQTTPESGGGRESADDHDGATKPARPPQRAHANALAARVPMPSESMPSEKAGGRTTRVV